MQSFAKGEQKEQAKLLKLHVLGKAWVLGGFRRATRRKMAAAAMAEENEAVAAEVWFRFGFRTWNRWPSIFPWKRKKEKRERVSIYLQLLGGRQVGYMKRLGLAGNLSNDFSSFADQAGINIIHYREVTGHLTDWFQNINLAVTFWHYIIWVIFGINRFFFTSLCPLI